MEQEKTGKFIQELRKEKGLTQSALAEKLSVTDKAVSKWETGKGFPDVSILVPLCEILGVSVNELLSGERLTAESYREKTEDNVKLLLAEKTLSKKKYAVIFVLMINALVFILLMGLLNCFDIDSTVKRVIIITLYIMMLVELLTACAIELGAGTYECKYCKHRFVPTLKEYIFGAHTFTTRYLRCPKCGRKGFCKKRLTH